MNRRKGTTLVELAIVIVFASIALPTLLYSLSTILEGSVNLEDATKASLMAMSRMELVMFEYANGGFGAIEEGKPATETEYVWNPDAYYPRSQDLGAPPGEEAGSVVYMVKVGTEPVTKGDLNLRFRAEFTKSLPDFDPEEFVVKRVIVSVHKGRLRYEPGTWRPILEDEKLLSKIALIISAKGQWL